MNVDMEIDSPYNNQSDTSSGVELQDSPLVNVQTKTRPLRPVSHKRTNSLKRPLTMSPKVDSPTCSGLAADFCTNFHVNVGNFANPKKILLPSMMCEENKENAKKVMFRKGKRVPAFKSDSLASSFYHHRSNSSSSLLASSQSSSLHNRSRSLLDTSAPLQIPPPTQVSPETQSIINNSRLKKSFSLINPQHHSLEFSESSSSSDNDESDRDDESGHLHEVGSPLQQKNRSHSRSRLQLNSDIKNKLQRATSLIQPPQAPPPPKPKLFKLSTTDFGSEPGALSAGANQLTSNINSLNFGGSSVLDSSQIDKLHLDGPAEDFGCGNSVLAKSPVETFFVDDSPLPRINVDQFHEILVNFKDKTAEKTNRYLDYFDELMVIDCRFEYEFKGGHIDCALNVSSKRELEDLLLNQSVIKKTPMEYTAEHRKLMIFHCEFSSHRGPLMANLLRTWDRYLNKEYYPHLYYPDIVILEGGYQKFYQRFNGVHCYPLNYIEMHDPQFKDECEDGLYKLRRDSKMSLNRKTSFHGSSASLSLRKSYTSTSVLSFAESSKSTSIFSFSESTTDLTATAGDGELGGFGGAVDLDDLCDESPILKKTTMLKPSPVRQPQLPEFKKPASPQKLFKLPQLPNRKTLHFRSKTMSSLSTTPPHFPHFTDLTKRFEKHVDTPITKK
ncbi:hypothetical protein OGAPHI_000750 [Ogataea philodendri]|uniref:M-phase inducer phosphatase n=1 Tax=Ogataea philodendri TaxID=1378263 RepID=A0A9P8PGW6_9ASCO|nr:uncharacterized protein OGAPHI_000750 [Ogataea philodendri]KAH3671039.1 hypothetical protein OGAPHI_000750 [Ogataea philodendri]